jgi:hypothetical protein
MYLKNVRIFADTFSVSHAAHRGGCSIYLSDAYSPMRLTNQSAAALKVFEGKAYVIVFDDDLAEFGMRGNVGGSRAWFVQYLNLLCETRGETLAKVGVQSATDARRAAAERLFTCG